LGKNDTLYVLLAIGGALYFYNTNPAFKTKVDQMLASLKGQSVEADPGTDTTLADTTPVVDTTTPTAITPNPSVIFVGNGGNPTLASVNAENCKASYGGSCTGECNKNGVASEECTTCIATCGPNSVAKAKSVTPAKKANTNSSHSKKVARTITPAKSKGSTNTSPFDTTPKKGCPARCAPFRLTSPGTYSTCCKGAP
jgi:hypothetical protein